MSSWYSNPDWWQVILTVAGAAIATLAFRSDREAVLKTQRADLGVTKMGLKPNADGRQLLTRDAAVEIHIKNFGPTRASDIRVDVRAGVHHSTQKQNVDQPLWSLAAGASHILPFPPLGECLEGAYDAFLTAQIELSVSGSISYADVFGRTHTLPVSAVFDRKAMQFRAVEPI